MNDEQKSATSQVYTMDTQTNTLQDSNHIVENMRSPDWMKLPTIGGPPIFVVEEIVKETDSQSSINSDLLDSKEEVVALPTTQPISCMLELLTGSYSECGSNIPNDKRQAAYNAFVEITGYKPVDWNHLFNDINEDQKTILVFNSFYIFVPILIIILIAIWMMVGFGWFNWVIGLYLTISAILILYMFSIIYRIHVQTYLDSKLSQRESDINDSQHNFENSVAYWPQGLFGVACAVTATGSTGWICNEPATNNQNKSYNESACGCKTQDLYKKPACGCKINNPNKESKCACGTENPLNKSECKCGHNIQVPVAGGATTTDHIHNQSKIKHIINEEKLKQLMQRSQNERKENK
jgi:hypothetical protein